MKRIRPSTVVLLAMIAALGYAVAVAQHREGRLREALAVYQEKAGHDLHTALVSFAALDWPDGTPLRVAIAEIEKSPTVAHLFPRGLPIVFDPDGLAEVGQTIDSPVSAPPKESIEHRPLPLSRQLRAMLQPLGLDAELKQGTIVITARSRVERPAKAEE
jgi:hypothetical protein